MHWRKWLRGLTPPILIQGARFLSSVREQRPEWEYIPEGWSYAQEHPEVKGWKVPAIGEVYRRKWPRFASLVAGNGPLGVNHETALSTNTDIDSHNLTMTFAYVLALAARRKERIRFLDWGGGIGHYYLLARALMPEVAVDYSCRDLPHLCSYGAELFPEQQFFADDRWRGATYDLVMASSSLHYKQDWQPLLRGLCSVAADLLFITRLPIVRNTPSFVFIQRPYRFGYDTEYLGWCLNEQELLRVVDEAGLALRREFVHGFSPMIRGAPGQNAYRGYLFQRQPTAGP